MNKEEKINKFIDLVLSENEKFNLTAILTKEEFKTRHIEDSLFPSKVFDFNNKTILDLGSGAGFPGIPLAIKFPSSIFILVEPLEKRANFLKMIKKELELENVEVLNIRMEDYDKNHKVDVIVSRAVSELPILLELSIPFIKVDGTLIAYKGKKGEEEIKESENALKLLNSKVVLIQKDENHLERGTTNIFIKKEKETNQIYPRQYQKIKKNPL